MAYLLVALLPRFFPFIISWCLCHVQGGWSDIYSFVWGDWSLPSVRELAGKPIKTQQQRTKPWLGVLFFGCCFLNWLACHEQQEPTKSNQTGQKHLQWWVSWFGLGIGLPDKIQNAHLELISDKQPILKWLKTAKNTFEQSQAIFGTYLHLKFFCHCLSGTVVFLCAWVYSPKWGKPAMTENRVRGTERGKTSWLAEFTLFLNFALIPFHPVWVHWVMRGWRPGTWLPLFGCMGVGCGWWWEALHFWSCLMLPHSSGGGASSGRDWLQQKPRYYMVFLLNNRTYKILLSFLNKKVIMWVGRECVWPKYQFIMIIVENFRIRKKKIQSLRMPSPREKHC